MNADQNRDLIRKARSEIYSWATNDLTCQLAKEVMSIGLAKIKSFLQAVESDPNEVLVVFGPDGSITRNKSRFSAGVGYGCAVVTKEYIFPSLLHPNGCGFGLYYVEDMPALTHIMDRLVSLKRDGVPVGDKKGKWDVWKSNHFIDILRLDSLAINKSRYSKFIPEGDYVLIHSSQQTEKQMLSYWKDDEFVKVNTPFGMVGGLVDQSREDYLKYFQRVEEYSKQKRTSIAEKLFGEKNITCISNPTHQGYYKENDFFTMRLGLYNTLDSTGENTVPLFPIGFNAYSFIYLYEGFPNVKRKHWTNHQLKQAQDSNHAAILDKINILPHGGGYKLIYPFSKAKTISHKDDYYYELSQAPMESRMLIQDVNALEYGYRTPSEVLPLVERLDLGKLVARFVPTQVIKY
ncbi:MAG: hypothetical protein KAT16_01700 [Candidatus Heimdallarchaeota archaeon]|nr:hypothetical protein [Candidatus Heimdallarchaeota archaeon]